MSFDESPSLDQFQNGMPEQFQKPDGRRKRFRLLLLVLMLIVAAIAISVVLKDSHALENFTATGLIRGKVVDDNGQPFHGSIFILGTDLATQTDEQGNFELSGVPAGEQTLIVADELIGRDFTIQVTTASELQIGEIRFVTTAIPPNSSP